jgi:DNA-binding LytR/AlgR family response regulator
MVMKCIIVDDNREAIEALQEYIDLVPFLELEKSFTDGIEAMTYLNQHSTDLLFLDIEMPKILGTQLYTLLKHKPCLIFTTANSSYALESYNLAACDYLMKPITFDRFFKAVNKAFDQQKEEAPKQVKAPEIKEEEQEKKYFFIKNNSVIEKVQFEDVLFIKGLKDYVWIQTSEKKIVTLQTMKNMEESLPSEKFIRIHKSYIISLDHIRCIDRHRVLIGEERIPIGETYKQNFYQTLKEKSLLLD